VLRLTGASVIAASGDEAIDILQAIHFDLVIFCHTVSPPQREKISLEARKLYMDVRMLNVLPFTSMGLAPDEAVADPAGLLAKVTSTLQNARRAQQPDS
jgi:hypothetical protein